MGINFGEKELFFVLLAFMFLAEAWYLYHKYLQTKQQQQQHQTDDCFNNKAAKSKSKEEIEKVVNSLMHKVTINTNLLMQSVQNHMNPIQCSFFLFFFYTI
jgi:hypothetical protein